MLALDCESCLIAPGLLAPPLVCVQVSDGETGDIYTIGNGAQAALSRLLVCEFVGHNIAYDMAIIGAEYPHLLPAIFAAYDADRITDTGIRQKLIDIAHGERTWLAGKRTQYSLAALTSRLLDVDLPKEDTWRLRYGELRDVPLHQWPADAKSYALDDAHATWHVWQAQEEHAELLEDQYRQARSAFMLHLMSCWGIHTNPDAVAELKHTTETQLWALGVQLQAAGLVRADGSRDTKAAAARNPKGKRTATGKVALDKESCRESGDPMLAAYAELSHLTKVLGTDIDLLQKGTIVPIQTRYDSLIETGRVSSANPNLTNIPR